MRANFYCPVARTRTYAGRQKITDGDVCPLDLGEKLCIRAVTSDA